MALWILLGIWVLGWGCIPHLLLLNKRPTATLAWLWAIFLFPVVGPVVYLMIGSEQVKRLRRNRRQKFRSSDRRSTARDDVEKTWQQHPTTKSLAAPDKAFLESLSEITQLPCATASSLRVLRKAPAFYAALEKDIAEAKREIQIETYIWRDDEVGGKFLKLLVEAVKRGVTVRLLVDELGSLWTKSKYFQPLIAAGGQFSWCHTLSPLRNRYSFNLRNHRKLQIIDGRIAYVGGMNFGREYLGLDPVDGDWSDVQIRTEGSVAQVFLEVFAEDWFFATGKDDIEEAIEPENPSKETTLVQVLRSGPDEDDHPMLRINLALIAFARERLWIGSGYFVPGEIMQTALQVAAARGVDVRLLVSEKSEHPLLVKAGRSYYDALLRQGVKIFEYRKGIEHSKYVIIDDDWVSVGSSNLDERSMRLNFELSLLSHSPETNAVLSRIFQDTTAQSTNIDREEFDRRPYREKLVESALRPLSPLL